MLTRNRDFCGLKNLRMTARVASGDQKLWASDWLLHLSLLIKPGHGTASDSGMVARAQHSAKEAGGTMRTILLVAVLAVVSTSLGCKQGSQSIRRWGGGPQGQGSIEDQKSRAVVYDPYPMNDTGPEIVGGRPRGFTNPLSEPYRNELKSRPNAAWSSYPNY